MTKMFWWPGTFRSGPTITRPALSVLAFSHFPAAEARTPAAQTTVRLSIRVSPSATPEASHSVTALFSSTSTKSASRDCRAFSESFGSNEGSSRSPASARTMRVARVDVTKIGGERLPRQLGDGPGDLHAGRPAADDDEAEQAAPLLRPRLGLGALESEQDLAPERRGVLDLDALRKILPFVVAEIGVAGAGRRR